MSDSALSPQVNQQVTKLKPAVFKSVRQNFALGANNVVPSLQNQTALVDEKEEKDEIKEDLQPSDLANELAVEGEVVPEIKLPDFLAKPVKEEKDVILEEAAQASLHPGSSSQVSKDKVADDQEEFSSDFLKQLMPEDEPVIADEPIKPEELVKPVEPEDSPALSPNLAAAVPTAVAQAVAEQTNQANQSQANQISSTGQAKEVAPTSIINTNELPTVQYVENEPQVEISPEIESFLERVEDHQSQLPKEVVIADKKSNELTVQPLAQPVVVLPITPEIEKKGAHKSPNFSVRWLVEWSRKVIKMFTGRVVYKSAPQTARL